MYKCYSTYFLESDVEPYSCYVNESLWKQITNDLMANRIFIRINNGTEFWICSLGQPIYTSFNSTNHIYVPKWMLEQIGLEGVGENIEIDMFPSDIFDYSRKIVLQPHTSISHIESIQDLLSYEFTKLGVLKKDSTIVVNETLKFEVVGLEPASIVLCEGDEVVLEFVESLDSLARPPTPYPFEAFPPILAAEPSAPLIEEKTAPSLGGTHREGRYNPWRDKDFKPKSG
jgi:hypothetical protein